MALRGLDIPETNVRELIESIGTRDIPATKTKKDNTFSHPIFEYLGIVQI